MIREQTQSGEIVEFPRVIHNYTYIQTIGKGVTAVVISLSDTEGKTLACKIITRKYLSNHTSLERFVGEIEILRSVKHSSIIEIYDVLYTEQNVYVIMEYCEQGELIMYVIQNHELPLGLIQRFFFQICEGIYFLHDRGIAHRDIKPENILLDAQLNVKIADFGFSKRADSNFLMETPCGSPFYAAPEIFAGRQYDGKKSDIWSLGVVLFGLATGALPWTAKNQTHMLWQISNAQYEIPATVDPLVSDCIERCLRVDPDERPTAYELLRMPLLRDHSQQTAAPTRHRHSHPHVKGAASLIVKGGKIQRRSSAVTRSIVYGKGQQQRLRTSLLAPLGQLKEPRE